ncbi:MAG: hypothetical protein ACFE8C_02850 [Promethearchaeota archaeon]
MHINNWIFTIILEQGKGNLGLMSKKVAKLNKIIVISFIIIFIFFGFSENISFSYAQSSGEPIPIPTNYDLFEYAKIEGTKENISSINIQLPEPNWTITNVHINFSDISLGSEIRTIEDSELTSEIVWNKNTQFRNFALGTQIEILEVTELYGVFIKGYKTPQATEIIKFQLQGYDEGNNSPNGTIYSSIDLNISTSLDWYYQDFSSDSIILPIGYYSLVMNGTDLSFNPDAKYFWQKDDLDPQIPYLHTSSYDTSWDTGIVNTSFLCKLHQRVDRTYFPTELNMTAELNGNNYEIMNGSILGTGSLKISNTTYFSEETNLNIPLRINKSLILNFNCNYSVYLTNEFSTKSSVIIEESDNQWSLSPIISRISSYYYVEFVFPSSWYNLTLYRKLGPFWENVTSLANIYLNTSTIIIPNDIISGGAEWKITANSPNINFYINLPELEWEPGHQLEFTVNAPIVEGNLTFYLINPLGFGYNIPIDKREVVSGETYFSYILPTNSREGSYNIIIYWNNNTDAGVQSQQFEVSIPPVPFTIDPIWIVIGIVIAIGGTTAGLLSYRTIKKYRIKKLEESRKLYNKCMDVMNLDYIIVSDKKSGLNVYQQKFSDKEVDAAMISGFLQAIHSFGIELIKVEDSSQTIKLEYKDSIIIMTEFVNLRLILLMKEPPSSNFFYSLEDLAYDIFKYFGNQFDKFNGDIKPFKPIEKLLKHHLSTSLTYPLEIPQIENLDKIKLSPSERVFVNRARSYMKKNNSRTFYLSYLLLEKECSPKDLEIIFNLIERDIFHVTDIRINNNNSTEV